ncbi:hypothetical protein [Streptomyces mobaraensis]|uniref:Uncharacterized protein n=1 Tax=Streptomyces mobaraensis TaxID=35621 RepID=A0A5N5W1R7_STRMB|nr:hypothetical protein [Streptomyces mobaraensis]KAB7835710.1 hypothetical protein FRZ00_26165 [Streptomyces mobaraensis]
MTATTVTIHYCVFEDELFRWLGRQSKPQPVYVELDLEDGMLLASYDVVIGSGAPPEVCHRRTRRYYISSSKIDGALIPTADGANRLLDQIRPLAQQVLDGASIEWDGNNKVGVLDSDAQDAEAAIESLVEDPDLGQGGVLDVWDLYDVGALWTAEEAGITGATTDEELIEIAKSLLREFRDGVGEPTAIVHGLDKHLQELRDEAADDLTTC